MLRRDGERPACAAHTAATIVIAALGLVQLFWYRQTLNPDGVAYLDLSDEVLAGRWGGLVQAYWSPLYPVLLAAGRLIGGQGAWHETTIAHVVNAIGLLCALVAWRALLAQLSQRSAGLVRFDDPLSLIGGYAVFVWARLWLMSLHFVTPDVWLAACVFGAAALVLAHGDAPAPSRALWLGVVLGVGYLVKSVLLPVSPFFIAGAAVLTPRGQRLRTAARAAFTLACIAVPWIAAISLHEGRPTFGDNGRFNYGWFVSGDRWLSPDPARETGPGAAVFPRVLETPAVYAWPERAGTYAPWRDPSFFHAAMRPTANPDQQQRVMARSTRLIVFWMAPWGIALLALLAAGASWSREHTRSAVALAMPSVVALGGYAAVFVEGRYVAPFLALLIVSAFATLREASLAPRRGWLALGLAVALWLGLGVPIPSTAESLMGIALCAGLVWRAPARALATAAPVALLTIGAVHTLVRSSHDASGVMSGATVRDGARPIVDALTNEWPRGAVAIAVIGDGPSSAVWARQLRARIVAELPASQAAIFWAAPDSTRTAAVERMRAAGAAEIIATSAIPSELPAGWRRVPGAAVARYAPGAP